MEGKQMKRWKIWNAEPEDYSRKAFQILTQVGEVEEALLDQASLLEKIPEIEVLIVRLGLQVDEAVLSRAQQLKYILSATTGTDHIDMETATRMGIEVVCLKGEESFLRSIPSTAEHTWALLLALMRHIPQAYQHVLQEGWDRQIFRGHNLSQKRLGILGLGRVGRQVATFAVTFGCETGYYDPAPRTSMDGLQRFPSAEALMEWSEILCIHIPYDKSTHHFLNHDRLQYLPQGALVVNTSRGGIWDEKALVHLLQTNHLGGVATDVIENELEATLRNNSPLLQQAKIDQRILITPHIAGATFESMEMTEVFIAQKFVRSINSHTSTLSRKFKHENH